AHLGIEKLVPQPRARDGRDLRDLVSPPDVQLLREQVCDLRARLVNRGHDDVRGLLVRELDDVLAEVCLNGANAGRFERAVEFDLLGRHRLALDDRADAARARQLYTVAAHVRARARPINLTTYFFN